MINRIVLFDGACNLCDTSVKFIIKNDPKALYRFAPLQSQLARKLLDQEKSSSEKFESLILVENEKVYLRSTAALKIARNLKGLWPVFYPLIFIPSPIRDFLYDLIAKNRYKLFGRNDSCSLPDNKIASRFL